jgi:hypothetical protein
VRHGPIRGNYEWNETVAEVLANPKGYPDVSALIRAHRPAPAAPQETREAKLDRVASAMWEREELCPWDKATADDKAQFQGYAHAALCELGDPLFQSPPVPRIPTPAEVADAIEAMRGALRIAAKSGVEHVERAAETALAAVTFDADAVRAMGAGKGQR